MFQADTATRFGAAVPILTVQLLLPAPATLGGQVVVAETRAPIGGAVIRLIDTRSGALFSSERTDRGGVFRITGLPPSTYRLGVEREGLLLTADTPVALRPGQGRSLMVEVDPDAATDPEESEKDKKKRKAAIWDRPFAATLIVLSGAVAFGLLIDQAVGEEETVASPANP